MVDPVLASVPPSSACTETDLLAMFTGNCKRHIGICVGVHRHRLKCSGTTAVILDDLLCVAIRDLVRLRDCFLPNGHAATAEANGGR